MRTSIRITIAAIALFATQFHGATATVAFNSLPTAQGWMYVGNVPEANVFSLAGGVLSQNSIGTPGRGYYQLSAIDPSLPFSVSFRGRMLQEEFGTAVSGFAFGVEVDLLSQTFILGLGTGRVVAIQPDGSSVVTTSIDTSQFHDYLFTGNPANSSWQTFVDGTLIGSGTARPGEFGPVATISFGDLSSAVNARGEWTQFAFTQVPEPSTVALAGLGALALLARLVGARQKGGV